MLVQADKSRTNIIIYKEVYTNKIYNFLTDNNIQPLQKIPSTKTANISRKYYKNNLIFNKGQVKYLLQKKSNHTNIEGPNKIA